MEKTLILANTGIGNHICSTIVLAKALSRTSEVYGLFNRKEGYSLLRHTPYFKSCILCENLGDRSQESLTDLAKTFCLYDFVYIPLECLYYDIQSKVDQSLLTNMVKRTEFAETYFPDHILDVFGLQNGDIRINIEWYKDYYQDFKCKSNTVLINGKSGNSKRTYNRISELADFLPSFDVRQIDTSIDIRTNLHLIDQVKYVLTTDTSILWMTKALGKRPYVFCCNKNYKSGRPEEILGIKNIIKDPEDINSIEPKIIANAFLASIDNIPKLF